jgi:hypothetical protein
MSIRAIEKSYHIKNYDKNDELSVFCTASADESGRAGRFKCEAQDIVLPDLYSGSNFVTVRKNKHYDNRTVSAPQAGQEHIGG